MNALPDSRPRDPVAPTERSGLRSAIALEVLKRLPPSLRASFVSRRDFLNHHALRANTKITIGPEGISFDRSRLYSAIRQALGEPGLKVPIEAIDGVVWNAAAESDDGPRIIALVRDGHRLVLPGLLSLSPEKAERLAEFDERAMGIESYDPVIASWRRRIENGPLEDEDVDGFRSELGKLPMRAAAAIAAEIEKGESSIAILVPATAEYYDRLVGPRIAQAGLSEFVRSSAAAHIKQLIEWHPREGLKLALLMASHTSVSSLIAQQGLASETLSETFEWLAAGGDRISQVGAIEVGLALLRKHPQLEEQVLSLVREIMSDDSESGGRLGLLSSLIIFVDGELARTKVLGTAPPYWRRLAAIAQASLIERELISAGVATEVPFSEWARQGRGQAFLLQTLIDLRLEPRWLPDFLAPGQLKAEFLGRVSAAAQTHSESIRSDSLRALLLGGEPGSIRPLLRFPFAYLPGPLEGGVDPVNQLPDEIEALIREALQSETLEPNSFTPLVNSALVFQLGPQHAELAAEALRRVKYQLRHGREGQPQVFGLLQGLANFAAVARSVDLANEVRILTRVMRARAGLEIGADDTMRIALIAAAAIQDRDDWAKFVGDWLTELAFEDLDSEAAAKLHSHILALCRLDPHLWKSCARAEAACAAVQGRGIHSAPG